MAKIKILVVEDEVISARALQRNLEDLGYEVLDVALKGDEAIWKATRLRPDLVLMDIHLPGGMDGIEAAGQIQDKMTIPIIFLTGRIDDETFQRAKVTLPIGYLLKPFNRRELQICIEMALYKHAMENRFRHFIEKSLDGIIVIDEEGNVVNWNPSMVRITGHEPDEVLGKQIWEVQSTLAPRERQTQQVCERRKTFTLEFLKTGHLPKSSTFENTEIERSDGTRATIQVSTFPIETERGIMAGAVVRELTEANKMERMLRENERRLRLITDNMLDIVGEIDMNLIWQYVSPSCQRVLGYAPDQVLGRSISDLIHEDDVGSLVTLVQIPPGIPMEGTMELRFRHTEGHYVWLEVIGKFIRDEYGSSLGAVFSAREITDRKISQDELRQLTEKLTSWVNDLERRNRQLALVNEMGELLQSCRDFEEAYAVVGQHAEEIFWGASGAIYIRRNSTDLLEAAAVWGERPPKELAFTPQDCWAMRRMQPHIVESDSNFIQCDHVPKLDKGRGGGDGSTEEEGGGMVPEFRQYLCVPMVVQGEARGVLHLQVDPRQTIANWEQLTVTLAERVGLALANLELRERLLFEAIRDPLTSLFNRRYMEQTLERELRRAVRRQRPLGLIMVDIDHFKQFNDRFSYAAGDALLRALGEFLQSNLRIGDIVCRYGGEEFILILPEASLDDASQIAEDLREQVKTLKVQHHGQSLGPITISLGVAAYPEHGTSPEDVLRAVDTAIHQAKYEGRDRMIMAER